MFSLSCLKALAYRVLESFMEIIDMIVQAIQNL